MVQTRKSFGNPNPTTADRNVRQKRRSLEISTSLNYQKVYPDLIETTSYATTIQTTEQQDDDDVYETENDDSFASSQCSDRSYLSDNDTWKYGLAVIGVILAIVLGVWITGIGSNGKQSSVAATSYQNYIDSIRHVLDSPKFSSISKDNRVLLKLIGRKVFLEPENLAPLVVLVGGKTAKEFCEAVNQVVQKAKSETPAGTGNKSIRVESDTNRAELHENLREILGPSLSSQSSPRSAVVLDVDLLKWDAVLVLHAFADHENYPVPKAVLFLTVSDDSSIDTTEESCDEKMVRFLTSRWIENGGSSDNIPPIIARISYFICV
ncbi:hypothetical protein GCK72_002691 [Caenorhabditis remanei]|uniref:Uncharacterized protein n=1 Tax=Caenorhabditis remanei TaxID=31234 RepID=A0A6A5HWU9_CAERE|nr:hypothetical protein GCK72_002691 [Caenorhabditis remanei]KAF1770867.1 hypothetical protein GCK72_002691 [Caenorhabditis remanei]